MLLLTKNFKDKKSEAKQFFKFAGVTYCNPNFFKLNCWPPTRHLPFYFKVKSGVKFKSPQQQKFSSSMSVHIFAGISERKSLNSTCSFTKLALLTLITTTKPNISVIIIFVIIPSRFQNGGYTFSFSDYCCNFEFF